MQTPRTPDQEDQADAPTRSSFTVLVRVRYAECDAQGVVFNARYGDYVDLVATEFYRHLFGSYQHMLEQGMDTQVVSLRTDWSAPAHFDDVLACRLSVASIGNTSFSLQIEFSDHQSGKPIATSTIVYVAVTPAGHQKIRVPDFARLALEKHLEAVINLAGI